jgi:hypothetical protein
LELEKPNEMKKKGNGKTLLKWTTSSISNSSFCDGRWWNGDRIRWLVAASLHLFVMILPVFEFHISSTST